MNIHAICLIKNEADVIEECLKAATSWCDHIYVFDNGSTDGTWEVVLRLAEEVPKIHAWKSEDKPFKDSLRKEVFEAFRHRAGDEDWWCRLDADEFYVQSPRPFLLALPKKFGVVWYASLSYYFSDAAAHEYEANPEKWADSVPVAERCRYYHAHWSEARFCRHEAMVQTPWPTDGKYGWPQDIETRAGSCPVRLLCKHYAYRSPSQIERRLATRKPHAVGGGEFAHEAIENWASMVDPAAVKKHRWKEDLAYVDEATYDTDWKSRVLPAANLHYDHHDGRFVVDDSQLPAMPGEAYRSISEDAVLLAKHIGRSLKRRLVSARSRRFSVDGAAA